MTTRGFGSEEAYRVGELIAMTVFNKDDDAVLARIADEVKDMLYRHPLYKGWV